jgi:hypothetical protein
MKKNSLSHTNPHLKNKANAWRLKVRSIASSTAIETGESIESIEKKINSPHFFDSTVTLA